MLLLIAMMMLYTLYFMCLISCSLTIKTCFPQNPFVRFFKIRSCYKSSMAMVSWKNFNQVGECMKFAREKRAFAFNFSPPELKNISENRRFRNCQILGCPEITNTSTLVYDPLFDYYSVYGNFKSIENAICIKSVGLFSIIQEKRNYTDAVAFCQNLGADLANILSESRTNALATLLKSMKGWYKAAYVGLDDMDTEGLFETPLGYALDCTKYRAWSVGHPRSNRKKEDCVILDAERVWRAINCKIKLGFICEFYPMSPDTPAVSFKYKNCRRIKNKRKLEKCLVNNEMFDLFNASPRTDQCALLNDFELT